MKNKFGILSLITSILYPILGFWSFGVHSFDIKTFYSPINLIIAILSIIFAIIAVYRKENKTYPVTALVIIFFPIFYVGLSFMLFMINLKNAVL